MTDTNLTHHEICFYVVGTTNDGKVVTLKVTKLDKGWNQSVFAGKAPDLNNQYLSNQTRDELNGWFACDFRSRYRIFTSLGESLEHHAQKESSSRSKRNARA